VANSGVITALDGAASQYVRGDGTLADFPTSTGGGSSVSYYLNSSVSQGTIGGVAYRQLGKTPIAGAGTDIVISSNGYVASYLTDANDPALLEVPAGNFNCEFYFSVNNNTGNPFTYAEVYKYDGTTFTLIGTSVGVPEYITEGTVINPYYFAVPVAQSVLTVTDRIAIRIYVNVDGRTVTLHTENNHLCQVVTTFSKGLISLNNLTRQNQFFATGTSGTDFGISSSVATHTFNLPVASAANTGKLSSTDWSTFNNKQAALTFTAPLDNTSNTISIPAASASVDGYLDNADWTTFNNKQNAITLTTTGTSGAATLIGATLNIPNYGSALSAYVPYIGATANLDMGSGSFGINTGQFLLLAKNGAAGAGNSAYLAFINAGATDGVYLQLNASNNIGFYGMTSSVQTSQVAYISRAGDFSGNSFIKTGGTSSQFLKADGSVDSTAYGTGSVTSVATSAPLTGGTITTSGTIGITQATTSTNGYLSSTDWNTFNNKLSTATAASTYVPYSGATANLDMGSGSFGIGAGKFLQLTKDGSDILGVSSYLGFVNLAGTDAVYFQLNASNNLGIFSKISNSVTPIGFISATGSFNGSSFVPTSSTIPTNGMYLSAANTLDFATNTTNRLTINSSGNVGIGTSTANSRLEVKESGTTNSIRLGAPTNAPTFNLISLNGSVTEGQYIGFVAGGGSNTDLFYQSGNAGSHIFRTGNGTAYTERMRITSGGNVGIGVTPASVGGIVELAVGGATSNPNLSGIRDGVNAFQLYSDSGGSLLYERRNLDLRFGTNNTERMRITSGGYTKMSPNGTYLTSSSYHEMRQTAGDWTVGISNTNGNPRGIYQEYTAASPNGTANQFLYCADSTALRMEVRSNGGIANYATNNVVLSDERLKKDITPLESVWNKIKNIEIVKYKFKDQTHDDFNMGVIAQQVEDVAPELIDIDGWGTLAEDGTTYKGIYEADIHYYTIKALQEAMLRIEEQQAQIEELKALIKNK
jgi:hypothetical protein